MRTIRIRTIRESIYYKRRHHECWKRNCRCRKRAIIRIERSGVRCSSALPSSRIGRRRRWPRGRWRRAWRLPRQKTSTWPTSSSTCSSRMWARWLLWPSSSIAFSTVVLRALMCRLFFAEMRLFFATSSTSLCVISSWSRTLRIEVLALIVGIGIRLVIVVTTISLGRLLSNLWKSTLSICLANQYVNSTQSLYFTLNWRFKLKKHFKIRFI